MAAFEIMALNEGTPQLRAPGVGDTLVANQTWNAGGTTFTGLQVNITDTASAAGSLLANFLIDGISRFNVRKSGVVLGTAISNVQPTFTTSAADTSGFGTAGGFDWTYIRAGSPTIGFAFNRLEIGPGNLTFGASLGSGFDIVLTRDAANTLAQRNGRTAQRFRVYNDFNGSSDGEWFDIDWATTAGVCTIGPRANGTGVVRPVTAVGAWTFSGTIFTGTILAAGNLRLDAPSTFYWDARSAIESPSNGNILLRDNAGGAFGLLQLGGVTSSFPALKRSGAALQARLADDSAFADFVFRIPTTNPGPGTLWNNGGVLTIGT